MSGQQFSNERAEFLAYDWLRGHRDEVVYIARRFTTPEIREVLAARQFTAERLSYANTVLFPFALVKWLTERWLPSRGRGSDVQLNPSALDALLVRLLFLEASWLRCAPLPFGLTVIAVARKEGS